MQRRYADAQEENAALKLHVGRLEKRPAPTRGPLFEVGGPSAFAAPKDVAENISYGMRTTPLHCRTSTTRSHHAHVDPYHVETIATPKPAPIKTDPSPPVATAPHSDVTAELLQKIHDLLLAN